MWLMLMVLGLWLGWVQHVGLVSLSVLSVGCWLLNRRSIQRQQNLSWMMSSDYHWHVIESGQAKPVECAAHWHLFGHLFVALKSENTTHHRWIERSNVGGPAYARLLVGLKAGMSHTETKHE